MTKGLYIILITISINLLAQGSKYFIDWYRLGKRDWRVIFSTGGLPSSHSATVTALAIVVGTVEGFGSTMFAISLVLALIVMHDAMGVRREAGKHAEVLNELVADFEELLAEIGKHGIMDNPLYDKKLKILLGHKPVEVLTGFLFGIIVPLPILFFFPFVG
ncbi:MAG: divergent PAP2 family protein [Culicoidibacterales bacterium]